MSFNDFTQVGDDEWEIESADGKGKAHICRKDFGGGFYQYLTTLTGQPESYERITHTFRAALSVARDWVSGKMVVDLRKQGTFDKCFAQAVENQQ